MGYPMGIFVLSFYPTAPDGVVSGGVGASVAGGSVAGGSVTGGSVAGGVVSVESDSVGDSASAGVSDSVCGGQVQE